MMVITRTANGQSYTSVTATLTDGSGQIWTNATVTFTLRPAPNNPATPVNGGRPVTDSPQVTTTDATGTFSFAAIDDNTKITPAGSVWTIILCPNATVPVCSQIGLSISGTSMNLTGPLSSILVTPVVNTAPTVQRAYSDTEANGGTGAVYWNTVTNTLHGCTFFNGTNCGNWVTIGGSGGSGTVVSITAGTGITLAPNPITVSGTVSLTNQVTAGSCTSCNLTINAQGQTTAFSNGTGGGGIGGSGTSNRLAMWSNSTTLTNAPIQNQPNASFPGGSYMTTIGSLYITPQNTGGPTNCINNTGSAAPFCISQYWPDFTTTSTDDSAALITNGWNGVSAPTIGGGQFFSALDVQNGIVGTGTVTATLPNQSAIRIFSGVNAWPATNNYGIYIQPPTIGTGSINHHYGIYLADQTTQGSGSVPADPWGIYVQKGKNYFGSMVQLQAENFAQLPACSGATTGNIATVSDSTTGTVSNAITGGGTFIVEAYCNGTTWIVAAGVAGASNGNNLTQSTYIASCNISCTFTYPILYPTGTTPVCVCSGGPNNPASCNIQNVSNSACVATQANNGGVQFIVTGSH